MAGSSLCSPWRALTLLHVLLVYTGVCVGDTGYFWHVTDYHYDHTYWTDQLSCNSNVSDPGQFGDYWCDSPWRLVQDSIINMADIKQDVDFIIWTGDNVAHIDDEYLSLEINVDVLHNITTALDMSFPNVPIYPSLGNHDFFPSDQAKINDTLYSKLADFWADWIAKLDQVELFKEGGYYIATVSPTFKVIALNTNLLYTRNSETKNMTDPAGQLAWLENTLTAARQNNSKVIITAHIAPGLHIPDLIDWLYPHHKARLMEILLSFTDVIVATHFGHDHGDAFKILQTSDGSKAVAQFNAPSLTPWRFKIPTQTGVPHNPGMRLVEYDKMTGAHLNYHQYFINLTDSNTNGRTNWTKLYDFKGAYDVDDMSVASMRKFFTRLEKGKGKDYAQKYCNHILVSRYDKPCEDTLRGEIYCAGLNYKLTDATSCVTEYLKSLNAAVTVSVSACTSLVMAISALLVIYFS